MSMSTVHCYRCHFVWRLIATSHTFGSDTTGDIYFPEHSSSLCYITPHSLHYLTISLMFGTVITVLFNLFPFIKTGNK